MFYNSYGIRLAAHKPFAGTDNAINENKDIISTYVVYDSAQKRISVNDTDIGAKLRRSIDELKKLLTAYRSGEINEKA